MLYFTGIHRYFYISDETRTKLQNTGAKTEKKIATGP
jgi:hypothetical protein